MTERKQHFLYGIFLALLFLITDQAHKWFMVYHTTIPERPLDVTSFFQLVMVWNTGISFGMFQGVENGRYVLSAIALTIVTILLFWLKKTESKLEATSIAFIIGGALGNVIDRFHFGAVADFFYFHYNNYYFPAFNIADSGVSIGAVLLCYCSFFPHKQKEINEEPHEETTHH